MNDWRHILSEAPTVPLGEAFDVLEAPVEDDAEDGGIGIGPELLGGRLVVDPLAARWFLRGGRFEDALRALLSSAPVALAVASDSSEAESPVTGALLKRCPMPQDLVEPEQRGSVQQLEALWKRAETVGLNEEICRAFDRVAAELYALGLNDLMAMEEARRHLIAREE